MRTINISNSNLSSSEDVSSCLLHYGTLPWGHLLEAQQFLLYLICKTKNGQIRSSCAESTSNICCVITLLSVSSFVKQINTPLNPSYLKAVLQNHWCWDQNSCLEWVVMNSVTGGPVSSTTKQEREYSLRSIIPQPAHLHTLPREASLHLMITDEVTTNDNAHEVTNEPTSPPSFTCYQKQSWGFPSNSR